MSRNSADAWADIFAEVQPELEYQHLRKVTPLPSENLTNLLYRILAVQCEYAEEGWLLEVVKDIVGEANIRTQKYVSERLDKINVKGRHVNFSPMSKKVVLNLVTAWVALGVFPYGRPTEEFSDQEVKNTAWFTGLGDRLMVATSIQWRVLIEMLRRANVPAEEEAAAPHNRIRNPGRQKGDPEGEQREPGDGVS